VSNSDWASHSPLDELARGVDDVGPVAVDVGDEMQAVFVDPVDVVPPGRVRLPGVIRL